MKGFLQKLSETAWNLVELLVRSWWVFLSLVGILLAAFYFWPAQGENTLEGTLRRIVIEGSGTAIILGIVYNLVDFINQSYHTRSAILEALSFDQELMKKLDQGIRQDIVRNAILAGYKENADVIYSHIMSTYLREGHEYYQDYISISHFSDTFDNFREISSSVKATKSIRDLVARFDERKYVLGSHEFGFERIGSEAHSRPFTVLFQLEDIEIAPGHDPKEAFLRKFVSFESDLYDWIENLNKGEIQFLMEKVFKLVASPVRGNFEQTLNYEASLVRQDPSDRRQIISVTIPSKRGRERLNRCYLKFDLPQHCDHTTFPCKIWIPVHKPEIRFTKAGSMRNLRASSFFTPYNPDLFPVEGMGEFDKHGPREINCRAEGWAFPTSGLVFNWINGKPNGE